MATSRKTGPSHFHAPGLTRIQANNTAENQRQPKKSRSPLVLSTDELRRKTKPASHGRKGMVAVQAAAGEIGANVLDRSILEISHPPVEPLRERSRQKSKPREADAKANISTGPSRPSQLAKGNRRSKRTLTANKPAVKEHTATVPAANQL
jgi:hypothetical protein